MITDKLKTILQDSGCTLVVYEQRELVNLYTDESHQSDIIGGYYATYGFDARKYGLTPSTNITTRWI